MDTRTDMLVEGGIRSSILGCLLAVWVLVGLFFYLNRYTQRRYFTIWAVAWLIYAIWLTLLLFEPTMGPSPTYFVFEQTTVAASAVFLFWGSLSCLSLAVRDRLMLLFLIFVVIWSYVAHTYVDRTVLVQLPIFGITGTASLFVGAAFLRFRQKHRLVGAGLLFFGFILWGVFLASFPFAQQHRNLISSAFLISTGLQLFIAVSMIVLVLEEVREHTRQMQAEIESTRQEQRTLQMKMLTPDESALLAEKALPADLQQAYTALRRTHHAAVRQERLRALGEMASGIAHDINNSLCPIVTFSEMLLDEPGLSPEARQNLRCIQTAGRDIARLVARMRDFYRRRTSHDELAEVDVHELVQQVIDLTRPRWRDMAQGQGCTVTIEPKVEGALPSFRGQPSELREALTNLIINSVDAMPHGGKIIVSAELRENGERQLILSVADNGMGMTEEVRKRCLEPFFSTKEQRGGSGLGLAMVYGVVQRHDGTVEIESEPGKGTTIRMCFPFRAAPIAQSPAAAAALAPGRTLRVLCIDDDPMLRDLLDQVLSRSGYKVNVAEDGEKGVQAFAKATDSKQPYDIVVTDLGMPVCDGVGVARYIREKSPKTPIVLLTGWGTVLGDDVGQASLFSAILSKPPRIAELLSTLARTAGAV